MPTIQNIPYGNTFYTVIDDSIVPALIEVTIYGKKKSLPLPGYKIQLARLNLPDGSRSDWWEYEESINDTVITRTATDGIWAMNAVTEYTLATPGDWNGAWESVCKQTFTLIDLDAYINTGIVVLYASLSLSGTSGNIDLPAIEIAYFDANDQELYNSGTETLSDFFLVGNFGRDLFWKNKNKCIEVS